MTGYKSWVELLTILDEEVPDEDRLQALKAMNTLRGCHFVNSLL
jgi:hypothetical protein